MLGFNDSFSFSLSRSDSFIVFISSDIVRVPC